MQRHVLSVGPLTSTAGVAVPNTPLLMLLDCPQPKHAVAAAAGRVAALVPLWGASVRARLPRPTQPSRAQHPKSVSPARAISEPATSPADMACRSSSATPTLMTGEVDTSSRECARLVACTQDTWTGGGRQQCVIVDSCMLQRAAARQGFVWDLPLLCLLAMSGRYSDVLLGDPAAVPLTCRLQTQVPKCKVRANPLKVVRCRSRLNWARCSVLRPLHCTAPAVAVMTAVSCRRQLASVMGGTSLIKVKATAADDTANTCGRVRCVRVSAAAAAAAESLLL
jgi:hypothetical protein